MMVDEEFAPSTCGCFELSAPFQAGNGDLRASISANRTRWGKDRYAGKDKNNGELHDRFVERRTKQMQ